METNASGKLLGLTIFRTEFIGHIARTINKGKAILSQLKRLNRLTPKMKRTLIKTLLIQVLEFPSIPICLASLTQKRKMQTVLNKAL